MLHVRERLTARDAASASDARRWKTWESDFSFRVPFDKVSRGEESEAVVADAFLIRYRCAGMNFAVTSGWAVPRDRTSLIFQATKPSGNLQNYVTCRTHRSRFMPRPSLMSAWIPPVHSRLCQSNSAQR